MPLLPARESLGGQLGRNLGEGLTALANVKLQGIQKKNQAHGLIALGYSPEQATQLSQLPEELLSTIVTNATKGPSAINKTSSADALKTLVPGLSDEHAQYISGATPAIQAAFYKHVLENPELRFGSEGSPGIPKEVQEQQQAPSALRNLQNIQQPNSAENNILQSGNIQQPNIAPTSQPPETIKQIPNTEKANEAVPFPGETLAKGIAETKKEKKAQLLEDRAEKRANKAEDRRLDREKYQDNLDEKTRNYLAPYEKQVEAAEKDINDYSFLQELAKTGDLQSGPFWGALEKVGISKLFRNFNTQLADKTISRLSLNSSTAYGPTSRITNYLEQNYIRSIPSLWNTREGIIAISELNKNVSKAIKIKHDERLNLIQKNGGKVSPTIESQVRNNTKDQIKYLEDEAMKIIKSINNLSSTNSKGSVNLIKYKGDKVEDSSGNLFKWDPSQERYRSAKKV